MHIHRAGDVDAAAEPAVLLEGIGAGRGLGVQRQQGHQGQHDGQTSHTNTWEAVVRPLSTGISIRSLPTILAASLSAAHRLPFSECGARRGYARGVRAGDVSY